MPRFQRHIKVFYDLFFQHAPEIIQIETGISNDFRTIAASDNDNIDYKLISQS